MEKGCVLGFMLRISVGSSDFKPGEFSDVAGASVVF